MPAVLRRSPGAAAEAVEEDDLVAGAQVLRQALKEDRLAEAARGGDEPRSGVSQPRREVGELGTLDHRPDVHERGRRRQEVLLLVHAERVQHLDHRDEIVLLPREARLVAHERAEVPEALAGGKVVGGRPVDEGSAVSVLEPPQFRDPSRERETPGERRERLAFEARRRLQRRVLILGLLPGRLDASRRRFYRVERGRIDRPVGDEGIADLLEDRVAPMFYREIGVGGHEFAERLLRVGHSKGRVGLRDGVFQLRHLEPRAGIERDAVPEVERHVRDLDGLVRRRLAILGRETLHGDPAQVLRSPAREQQAQRMAGHPGFVELMSVAGGADLVDAVGSHGGRFFVGLSVGAHRWARQLGARPGRRLRTGATPQRASPTIAAPPVTRAHPLSNRDRDPARPYPSATSTRPNPIAAWLPMWVSRARTR